MDVSTPLTGGMPRWPDDPEVRIEAQEHAACRVTTLSMSAHTGTHVDAPRHYFPSGAGVDEIPLEATIGRARVVAARLLPTCDPQCGERLLLKTGGDDLTADAARFLVERGVRTIGVDSLSVGGDDVHRTLLSAGVVIIEGLDLSAIEFGEYDLICLPLKIAGADGAPARAILRAR
jgi:arylformamidase